MIGRKLGNRYEILALIGGGGMSLVYQARDIYLNRIVALKVLREQFASDNEFVRRFRREAQAVASLSHPNIVSIYDVGQEDTIHYLVMEFIRGKTLKDVIQEQGQLPLSEAVDIAKQICDALEHAHENAIVHRDIKPHNILITRGGRVKVTDFGIARAVSTATVTHTRGIIGSVHYFSPEQAKGEMTGEKSDIYSLGIVLYEMVTGKLPFEGESPISIALKHIQTEPVPPSQYNSDIPGTLERIILQAISKEPKDRHENVRTMRLELMSALLDNVTNPKSGSTVMASKKRWEENTISENTLVFNEDLTNSNDNSYDIENVENSEPQNTPKKLRPAGVILITLLSILLLGGMLWGAGKFLIKEEVIVPDIVNLPAPEAQRILANKKLKMEVIRKVHHNEVEKGKIISQDPLPDTKTKSGRTIEVVVSTGPALVKVPKVIGISQIMADVTISNANLKLGQVDQVYSSEYPEGIVINQAPSPEDMVPAKTTVDLVVSKGPKPQFISMPSLIALPLDTVKGKLQEVGLFIGEIKKEKSDVFPKDYVIEQTPAPGQEIFQGSSVNLLLSEGPGPNTQQARVKVQLFESGEVRIEVSDIKGTRIAYQGYHQKGDILTKLVEHYGQGTITVYIDGKKTWQQVVPDQQ